MRVCHDSRDEDYRSPRGAVTPGAAVTLALDVWDAPGARATLRLWLGDEGEKLLAMDAVSIPAVGAGNSDMPARYQVAFIPEETGVVWYHFIITQTDGRELRYGACDGRFGGEGMLREWEPPSFKLSVVEPKTTELPWREGDVCYQADPGLFFQSDDGVRELDHLRELGVTVLMLLSSDVPCPILEDADDAAALEAAARERGIRMVKSAEESENDDFTLGDEMVRFMRGECSAPEVVEALETWRDDQLPSVLPTLPNQLSGTGRTRLVTRLAGAPAAGLLDDRLRESYQPEDWQRGLMKPRLWCASLAQALMPGVPCLYFGDEAGMEGYAGFEPDDGVFPWEGRDTDYEAIVQNTLDLRRAYPLLSRSSFSMFSAGSDVFGFWRHDAAGGSVCVLVNASLSETHDVLVPFADEAVSEALSGYAIPALLAQDVVELVSGHEALVAKAAPGAPAIGRYARIHLYQLGTAVLHFHKQQRLQRPMNPGLGILAHVTNLPRVEGDGNPPKPLSRRRGTLGAPAFSFIDWLAQAGVRYWQVLPVNPTDEFGSPYAGINAFAGNDLLLEEGSLERLDETIEEHAAAYREFCEREADWLEPYVAFMAIRSTLGAGKPWWKWPAKYRRFNPKLLDDADLAEQAEANRRRQFLFERQWDAVHAHAAECGVQVVGDMPIYVSADSADVWANRELFQVDSEGRPAVVAGCPPDAFAEDGQVWGNPVYDWDYLRETGYAWWLRRLERAFQLYDIVRLDHFIGFARYFSIPAGESARKGVYRPGPGTDLFRRAYEKFGPLPIIAEDLGYITPAVRVLGSLCGFPGMDIMQFTDGNDPLSGYTPRPEKVVYTGTHDNQTLLGYVESRYPDLEAAQTADLLMELAVTCDAPVCVLPLQDVLGLGDAARMNTPGTTEGNWIWQAESADVEAATDRLARLCALHRGEAE